MRISDWSSDVCSSDLPRPTAAAREARIKSRRGRSPDLRERAGAARALHLPSTYKKPGAWPGFFSFVTKMPVSRAFRGWRYRVRNRDPYPVQVVLYRWANRPTGSEIYASDTPTTNHPQGS